MALWNLANSVNQLENAARIFHQKGGFLSYDEVEDLLYEADLNDKNFRKVTLMIDNAFAADGCSGMVLTSAIVKRLTKELQRLGVKNVRLD